MKCLIKIFALFVFISCTKSTDSDKNLVEVFANNKQAVSVEHQYIRKNPNLMIFTNDNDLTINYWIKRHIKLTPDQKIQSMI